MNNNNRSLYKKLKNHYIKNNNEYLHFKHLLSNKENEVDFLKIQLFYTNYDAEYTHILKIMDRINFDIYFIKKIIKNYEFLITYQTYYSFDNDILLYPILEESNYDLELVQN